MGFKTLPNCVRVSFPALCAITAAIAYSLPRTAVAQPAPPPIPREAYAACEAKAEGDACTVHFGDRELSGTCAKEPFGSRLLCRPNDMPPPPH